MIKACGDAKDPQPERARDLWVEMTTEGDVVIARREEYDAIIRALSSTKTDYLEAFEILRQMIARHQDAVLVPFEDEPSSTWSIHLPTLETFTALLEGTKRAGDLERTRWILSEFVRLVSSSQAKGEKRLDGPDDEMMTGVFMTYAAWKPIIRREGLKVLGSAAAQNPQAETEDLGIKSPTDTANSRPPARSDSDLEVPSTGPSSSADAIRECIALFDQIMYTASISTSARNNLGKPFRNVRISTRLVNSYLSVHLAHSPSLAVARQTWLSTWDQVRSLRDSLSPNGWSYLHVLERCSSGIRGGVLAEDREDALQWGRKIWEEYRPFVVAQSSKKLQPMSDGDESRQDHDYSGTYPHPRERWLLGLGDRQIERCWRSIIRLHVLSGDIPTAMTLLDQFYLLHPPAAILRGYSPLKRTDLAIHMTSLGSIPEPDVSPHLLWKDMDVLHQRLVREEDWKGVAKVKWIAKGYEGALLKRRRFRLKGAGLARERRDERMRKDRQGEEIKRIVDAREVEEQGDGWETADRDEAAIEEAWAHERRWMVANEDVGLRATG